MSKVNLYTCPLTSISPSVVPGDYRLPLIETASGLCLINGRTYLVRGGSLKEMCLVKTGRILTDRRTGMEYAESSYGFSREYGFPPHLRGPIAQLHPDPALREVKDGLVLEMEPVDYVEGGLFHFFDIQHNIVWRRYTAEEFDANFADSGRSEFYCTKLDTLGMRARSDVDKAQFWNSFAVSDRKRCWIGITFEIVGCES